MSFYVGIDENGLGPQLGPLIVTSVLARVSEEAASRMESEPHVFLHQRLADSKKLVDHRHVVLAEAWARVLGPRGPKVRDPSELLEGLTLETMRELQSQCPEAALSQCWGIEEEGFVANATHLAQAQEDLERLRQLGIEVVWTRSSITCVLRMNQARSMGVGRMDLDLRAMEALILAARRRAGEELVARCGKVGGLMRYSSKFTLLSGHLATTMEESRSESAYRLAGLGRVHFLRDAEERDPLVSLASLVGKWVREVLMGRIVRFHRQRVAGLPDASGYNDPVTDRFVRDTQQHRSRLGIPDACFVREGKSKK